MNRLPQPLFLLCSFFLYLGCNDNNPKKLFTVLDATTTGLNFSNPIFENDSINIIDNEFVYNGAGVAIADINGDGLDDIFLAGNQVDNALFLNEGNLKFRDVSKESNIGKTDSLQWSSGVTVLDINLDGLQDIYVCNTFRKDSTQRKNLLFINQGNNNKNVPVFKEEASKYGLDDTTYSSHAQFFDYDNDGDLDVFIGVNRIEGINPNQFSPLTDDGTSKSKDILYENVFVDSISEPRFIDVSTKAGIRYHGYSHSTLIHDFNEDGWLDIYVANDFLSNDLIYINNKDGSFTNKAGDIFKHFSLSSMGSDITDVDNDGRMDIFTTEMQPYYNKRKKLFQGPSSYQKEIFTKKFLYEHQYTRNTLQQNLGVSPETGLPIFGEIGMYMGIQETDWSWAPLFADFDNDSWKDLLITNGFPKDVTDRDFGDFRISASRLVSKQTLIDAIPEIKIPNFIFKNIEGKMFYDATQDWGLDFGTFSNGAAYGDLDNDGDLDLVINNINDPVLLLENNANELFPEKNYLRIKLSGDKKNPEAFGSTIVTYYGNKVQRQSLLTGRGYLSQPEKTFHVGLGKFQKVDSLKIIWPNGDIQLEINPALNKLNEYTYRPVNKLSLLKKNPVFKKASQNLGLNHVTKDDDFIDFNFQRTIPHKFSQYGPSIAVGDINGDGLDDIFIAASRGQEETWFIQTANSTFKKTMVSYKSDEKLEDDSGSLLFDADNDGDLDLYLARGSAQYPAGHELYKDKLLLNDGFGNFTEATNSIPNMFSNTNCVKAADIDKDGDLDLFVGSRVLPFSYPSADRSYILENQSNGTDIKFVDATSKINADLKFPGLISDAIWSDFNNDFWPDLILVGEWMPIRFFENKNGTLIEQKENANIQDKHGWWNSIAAGDLDNDGDVDYVVGNVGRNLNFTGTKEQPVRLYAKDLDNNGTIDPLLSFYLRDSLGTKKEYLYHPWQDVTKQYVGIRKKYNSFGEFGAATLAEMFNDGLLQDAVKLKLNYMETSLIENMGSGKFKIHALPIASQYAPIYGIMLQDINANGFLDVMLVGNDFGMEVQQGMADAFNGLLIKNEGNLKLSPVSLEDSHFWVPGDAKSLVNVHLQDNKELVIASQNNDSLKIHEYNDQRIGSPINFKHGEVKARITFKNGRKRIQEVYWGNSFNSQFTPRVFMTASVKELDFYDVNGAITRNIMN
ncbi:VCBS repeat-containing protein [Maribacter sedimenticola]|nr:FG-GAP-like repeat-containing protein [Maribacter sedimenticola]